MRHFIAVYFTVVTLLVVVKVGRHMSNYLPASLSPFFLKTKNTSMFNPRDDLRYSHLVTSLLG